jgi:hypothetical protein
MECSQVLSDSLNQKELEKLCPVYPPLTLPNIRAAIAPMLQLPPEELTRLLFNLSREELLVWFGDVSWREDTLREGRREKVENFLRVRFGSLDEELLEAICADARRLANAIANAAALRYRIDVAVADRGVDSPAS